MAISKNQALDLIGTTVAFTYSDNQYRRGHVRSVRTAATGRDLLLLTVEGEFRSYDLSKISQLQSGDTPLPRLTKRECQQRVRSLKSKTPCSVMLVYRGKIHTGILLTADHLQMTVVEGMGDDRRYEIYPTDQVTDVQFPTVLSGS